MDGPAASTIRRSTPRAARSLLSIVSTSSPASTTVATGPDDRARLPPRLRAVDDLLGVSHVEEVSAASTLPHIITVTFIERLQQAARRPLVTTTATNARDRPEECRSAFPPRRNRVAGSAHHVGARSRSRRLGIGRCATPHWLRSPVSDVRAEGGVYRRWRVRSPSGPKTTAYATSLRGMMARTHPATSTTATRKAGDQRQDAVRDRHSGATSPPRPAAANTHAGCPSRRPAADARKRPWRERRGQKPEVWTSRAARRRRPSAPRPGTWPRGR